MMTPMTEKIPDDLHRLASVAFWAGHEGDWPAAHAAVHDTHAAYGRQGVYVSMHLWVNTAITEHGYTPGEFADPDRVIVPTVLGVNADNPTVLTAARLLTSILHRDHDMSVALMSAPPDTDQWGGVVFQVLDMCVALHKNVTGGVSGNGTLAAFWTETAEN